MRRSWHMVFFLTRPSEDDCAVLSILGPAWQLPDILGSIVRAGSAAGSVNVNGEAIFANGNYNPRLPEAPCDCSLANDTDAPESFAKLICLSKYCKSFLIAIVWQRLVSVTADFIALNVIAQCLSQACDGLHSGSSSIEGGVHLSSSCNQLRQVDQYEQAGNERNDCDCFLEPAATPFCCTAPR